MASVLGRGELQKRTLTEAIGDSTEIVDAISKSLAESSELAQYGVEILGLNLIGIKPTPETARALEAATREQMLLDADQAIYARRNASVEQERSIKENELNTQVAIEVKNRQIRETKMDAEKAVLEKTQDIERAKVNAKIELETKRKELVQLEVENHRAEADARAYALAAICKALADVDPKTLQTLSMQGMDSEKLIAAAFQEIAGRADKIGQLNISPDLLQSLISKGT